MMLKFYVELSLGSCTCACHELLQKSKCEFLIGVSESGVLWGKNMSKGKGGIVEETESKKVSQIGWPIQLIVVVADIHTS